VEVVVDTVDGVVAAGQSADVGKCNPDRSQKLMDEGSVPQRRLYIIEAHPHARNPPWRTVPTKVDSSRIGIQLQPPASDEEEIIGETTS
jgi:hypothetical protein